MLKNLFTTEEIKINSKVEILDSLRAFAALSVCLYHFICTVTGFIQTDWIKEVFSIGQYGVQLFFVISGFVIPWSMFQANYQFKNFFNFFLKRISRLEPPYLFSILLALLILYLRSHFLNRTNFHMEVSVKQIALHLGYLIPFFGNYQWLNQVYWTLAIEFQYYLLIALLFIPLIRSNFIIRIIIYLLFIFLSYNSDSHFLPYWLPVFLLGILVFLFRAKLISKYEFFVTSIVTLLYGFYFYPFWSMIYVLISIVALVNFSQLKLKGLNILGKFSYSIYLIHPLIGASFINILSHHCYSPLSKLILIILGMAITLFASWITYVLIEKPSKRLSASIKYQ